MRILRAITITAALIAAITAAARVSNYEKVDVYENLEVGQTVEFEGRDHRSTPCVYYSIEPENWDTYKEFIELTENMDYDNPNHEGLCGGDGGMRHFTIKAIKDGTIVINEYRNDCEKAILTVHHYTIGKVAKDNTGAKKHKAPKRKKGKKYYSRRK